MNALRRPWSWVRLRGGRDDGNAVVEFLGVAVVLLVPVVYLVLVLGRLQAAAFAVDGAAREAVRVVVGAAAIDPRPDLAVAADAAVRIALADQGLVARDAVVLMCDPSCEAPGAVVSARVEVAVDLPLVPAFAREVVPLQIPVSSSATGRVGRFVDAG